MSAYSPKFQACIHYVLHEEAGFVNDPNDPGGATNYGISIRSYKSEIGDINGDGTIDAKDVKILPVEKAIDIYHSHEWAEIHGDDLPEPMALALLDTAVNCGVSRAARLLQRAGGLEEDGLIGPKTLEFAQQKLAFGALLDQRRSFYRSLANFPRYGKGWLARVERIRMAANQMQTATNQTIQNPEGANE